MLQRPPSAIWSHKGLILPRNKSGFGSDVMGDPCIVWDEDIKNWRMILFAAPPGHGQAVHQGDINDVGPDTWQFEGALTFTNLQVLGGHATTHKPFIVLDPYRPNYPAKINGNFSLVTVSTFDAHKVVQQAWAEKLTGPWTLEEGLIIPVGAKNDFDSKHVDAVSAYYFPERKELLYFYMGYPDTAQARKSSPFGSAQAVAVRTIGHKEVTKIGPILEPAQQPGHWAGGWIGGLQLLPGKDHRWIGLINASPTTPDYSHDAIWREEPAPSLGGFAYCDEEWPVKGWHFYDEPIEWIDQIPAVAQADGEGVNQWRHYLLVLSDKLALFYNSGFYGQEQMYLKTGNDTLL